MAGVTAALTASSIGASLAGSGMSFVQSAQASRSMEKARVDAERAITEARRQLSENTMAGLELPMEQYEIERDLLRQSTAGIIDAAMQSERGVAPAATRIAMEANRQGRGISADTANRLYQLDRAKAIEQARLNSQIAEISKAEAEGAQLAVRDLAELRNKAMTEGFAGVSNALASGLTYMENYDPSVSTVDTSPESSGIGQAQRDALGWTPGTVDIAGFQIPEFDYRKGR